MPTYDYECDACGHRFEAFQSMMDDALTVCPECSEKMLRRLITGGTGVIFRGSGFYVNDSKKGGSSSSSPKKEQKEQKEQSSTTDSGSSKDTKNSEKKTA